MGMSIYEFTAEAVERANQNSAMIGLILCLLVAIFTVAFIIDSRSRTEVVPRLRELLREARSRESRLVEEIIKRDEKVAELTAQLRVEQHRNKELENRNKTLAKWGENK